MIIGNWLILLLVIYFELWVLVFMFGCKLIDGFVWVEGRESIVNRKNKLDGKMVVG